MEPHGLAFTAGLLIVGGWLYEHHHNLKTDASSTPPIEGTFVVPVCNLLAYALGGLALSQPPWVVVAVAVAATLLLTGRKRLHDVAEKVPIEEIFTAGQFLLLVGVMLPLLPDTSVAGLGALTPHRLALAVVTVSSLSYGAYLLERYVRPRGATLLAGVLGGMYSSTATTIVLARRSCPLAAARDLNVAVILATAVMYARIFAVVAIFNWPLARLLVLPLGMLVALSLVFALLVKLLGRDGESTFAEMEQPANPLQIGTALAFAALLVIVTFASNWAKQAYGHRGIDALAAVIGVTDIDPFVLSIAQGNVVNMTTSGLATAVLIAASSNNALKAAYTQFFGKPKRMASAAIALALLCAAGVAAIALI